MYSQRLLKYLHLECWMVCLSVSISFGQANHFSPDRNPATLAASKTDSFRAYRAIKLGDGFLNYNSDSAIYYYRQAARLADASKIRILRRLAYLKLGNEYLFYTDYETTINLLDKAEALGRPFPVDSTQLEILIVKARAFRSSGRYDTGLRLCLDLLNNYEHRQNQWPRQLALLHAELGVIHLHLHHFAASERYFQKQLALSKKSGDKRLVLIAFGNLGTLYGASNRFQEAERCFRRSYEIAGQFSRPILLGYVYINLGELAMHRKEYKAAISYLRHSLHYEDSYNIDKGYTYSLLARCYKESRQHTEALLHINQAIRIFHSIASLQDEQKAMSLKGFLLAQSGRFKDAYQISDQAQVLKDSLFGLEKEKAIAGIQANFDLERKQQQIAALKKNLTIQQQARQTAQLQLRLVNQQRVFFLSALLCMSCVFIFAFLAYRKQKKIGLILVQQKEEISKQTIELTELNKTKDKLFSLISHDLRSPVTRLKKQLNLLSAGSLPDEAKGPIGRLEAQTDQLLNLLTNLLDWSYIQLKGWRVNPECVDLADIVDNVISQKRDPISQKGLRILNQVPPSAWIMADKTQLEAIIRNLISNAVKFTPSGGYIRLSVKQTGEHLKLTIQDTGIGIPAEHLERIFSNPEVRQGTASEQGTGLGLRVCREMLGADAEALQIISKPEKGTQVSIRLTVAVKSAQSDLTC